MKSEDGGFPALKGYPIHHGIPSIVLRTQVVLHKALFTGLGVTEILMNMKDKINHLVFQITL